MRPMTQPYRSGQPRMLGQALEAMLAGRQPGQLNAADFDRKRRQDATFRQLLQHRMERPSATADVRGNFAGGFNRGVPPSSANTLAVDHWPGVAPGAPAPEPADSQLAGPPEYAPAPEQGGPRLIGPPAHFDPAPSSGPRLIGPPVRASQKVPARRGRPAFEAILAQLLR